MINHSSGNKILVSNEFFTNLLIVLLGLLCPIASKEFLLASIVAFALLLTYRIFHERYYFIEIAFGLFLLYNATNIFIPEISQRVFDIKANTILFGTRMALYSILISYGLINLFFGKSNSIIIKRTTNKIKRIIYNSPQSHVLFSLGFLILISTITWYEIIFKIDFLLLISNMRKYSEGLFFRENHYLQLIIIPFFIFLYLKLRVTNKGLRRLISVVLINLVVLYIITGARKEIFVVALIVIIIEHFRPKKFVNFLIPAFLIFVLPAYIRTGQALNFSNIENVLSEFIFPQCTFFITLERMNELNQMFFIEHSGLSNIFWAFWPAPLRLDEFQAAGVTFIDMGMTFFGIGFNPFTEIYFNFGMIGLWFMPLFIIVLFEIPIFLSKIFPEILIISFGYLGILGRSDIPNTLFFIIYSSIIFFIINRHFILK